MYLRRLHALYNLFDGFEIFEPLIRPVPVITLNGLAHPTSWRRSPRSPTDELYCDADELNTFLIEGRSDEDVPKPLSLAILYLDKASPPCVAATRIWYKKYPLQLRDTNAILYDMSTNASRR